MLAEDVWGPYESAAAPGGTPCPAAGFKPPLLPGVLLPLPSHASPNPRTHPHATPASQVVAYLLNMIGDTTLVCGSEAGIAPPLAPPRPWFEGVGLLLQGVAQGYRYRLLCAEECSEAPVSRLEPPPLERGPPPAGEGAASAGGGELWRAAGAAGGGGPEHAAEVGRQQGRRGQLQGQLQHQQRGPRLSPEADMYLAGPRPPSGWGGGGGNQRLADDAGPRSGRARRSSVDQAPTSAAALDPTAVQAHGARAAAAAAAGAGVGAEGGGEGGLHGSVLAAEQLLLGHNLSKDIGINNAVFPDTLGIGDQDSCGI